MRVPVARQMPVGLGVHLADIQDLMMDLLHAQL
jgi:hypothetical protein